MKEKKKEKKVYTLIKIRTFLYDRPNEEREVKGTLDELKDYFSYTLSAVNKNPKTIKSLISSVNKGYEIMGKYDCVELAENQE